MTAIVRGATGGMTMRPYNNTVWMNRRDMIDFVARRSRRVLLGPAIALAAFAVLPACGLVAAIGVSGRVVDRETGQPIEGAVVSLQRTAHCVSYHAYSRQISPVETRTITPDSSRSEAAAPRRPPGA
jgi:hypothetical protein